MPAGQPHSTRKTEHHPRLNIDRCLHTIEPTDMQITRCAAPTTARPHVHAERTHVANNIDAPWPGVIYDAYQRLTNSRVLTTQHNTHRHYYHTLTGAPHAFSHPNGIKPCTVHYRPKQHSATGPLATDAQDATHANAATMQNGHTRHDARTNACRIRNNEQPKHATCLALYPAFSKVSVTGDGQSN